jgi:hypothetical protein
MPWFMPLWSGRPSVEEGEVDGHQFVTPNIPGKLGVWADHRHGDYWFIKTTLDKWDGRYEPREDVIAECFSPV